MKIYLYLKTHNKTGLKYLGKTTQDPYSYLGSGILWKKHIKEYGDDVTTEILFETTSKQEFREVALRYSYNWNIVESSEFANLTYEEGQGGYTTYTADRNLRISQALTGRKNTWVTKGMNEGKVVAIDKKTGERVSVTREIFVNNDDLIGIGSINSGIPKTEEWKNNIKNMYKNNPRKGYKVQYKDKIYPSINKLCRDFSIGKGMARGMINRGEIIILEK